jgi:hypothetical protein
MSRGVAWLYQYTPCYCIGSSVNLLDALAYSVGPRVICPRNRFHYFQRNNSVVLLVVVPGR